MKRLAIAIAAAIAACSPQPAPSEPATGQHGQTGLEQVQLIVRSATGSHRFTVEVARTDEQQQTGMMFRTSIAPDRGMIFPYDPPREVAFWMRDTLIPLDMIFVRSDGTIVRIATAEPQSDALTPSGEAIAAVLEIAGGRAAELGIKAGDRVEW